jgi:hypothetical protein
VLEAVLALLLLLLLGDVALAQDAGGPPEPATTVVAPSFSTSQGLCVFARACVRVCIVDWLSAITLSGRHVCAA